MPVQKYIKEPDTIKKINLNLKQRFPKVGSRPADWYIPGVW